MSNKIIIDKSNLYEKNLDSFAEQINVIWGQRDIARPILFQWLSVMQHAGAVAEEVRKSSWDNVVHELAEVLVWWLSFISSISRKPEKNNPDLVFHLNVSPSDIVWFKFPNVCPLCFGYELSKKLEDNGEYVDLKNYNDIKDFPKEISEDLLLEVYNLIKIQPCQCMARKEFVENRTKAFKRFVKRNIYKLAKNRYEEKPSSLNELQDNINKIFDPNVSALTLHEITFHLLEEVGEVAEALSMLHQQPHIGINKERFKIEREMRMLNVCEELADVFAWIISLLKKTHQMLNCICDFAEKRWYNQPMVKYLKDVLQPTSNMVDLLWHTYSKADKYKYMVCEVCGKPQCDEKDTGHLDNCGMLFGKNASKFYNEITSVALFKE